LILDKLNKLWKDKYKRWKKLTIWFILKEKKEKYEH
jgi:hypothetical protein